MPLRPQCGQRCCFRAKKPCVQLSAIAHEVKSGALHPLLLPEAAWWVELILTTCGRRDSIQLCTRRRGDGTNGTSHRTESVPWLETTMSIRHNHGTSYDSSVVGNTSPCPPSDHARSAALRTRSSRARLVFIHRNCGGFRLRLGSGVTFRLRSARRSSPAPLHFLRMPTHRPKPTRS